MAAVLAGIVLAGIAGVTIWRSTHAIRSAAEDLRNQNEFRFVVRPFASVETAFEAISSPAVFLQAMQFQEHLYVAGPEGLFEYNGKGDLVHEYAAGRELPGAPMVAVTQGVLADSRTPELILATANDGILAFNGQAFRQILPSSSDARAVNAILATETGHLLLGTSKRGVLVYDGKRLGVFHPSLDHLHVTALAGKESDLWVGTLNNGVIHFHGGEAEKFSEAQGLPDPQVMSLLVTGDRTFAGTPVGVAEFDDGRFSRVLAPGVIATALLVAHDQLYVGAEDQGVIVVALSGRRPNLDVTPESEFKEVRQLFSSGESVFAVTRSGLYRRQARGLGWQRVLAPASAVLSDRNISALAADANGNLWIGYFTRGLDLMRSGDARVRHVEDEHVFCINRILPDAHTGLVNVATANGLVRFDGAGTEQQVLTRSDGLIAEHVTDVVSYRGGLALATPAGLTFLDSTGARSMYAFQGLVNNHVYALAADGNELMAGTLGGLSMLDKGDITANLTTANSGLTRNWITAVVRVDSDWLLGTYGAGIIRLDDSGKFHLLETASGSFEVNANAMLVTPDFVLAGSLGQGLYVLDRKLDRWSVVRNGLPSLNVTALAAANGYIYIGTDNGLVRIPEEKLGS